MALSLEEYYRAFLPVVFVIGLCFLWSLDSGELKAQNSIGGPYEADSSTVLLLHFNGDYENESDATNDARPHGEVSFVELDSAGVFGQQLRLKNESPENRSHLQVPDTASLDLTGSWTMEAWVMIRSFCSTQDCLRIYPRVLFKPGDPDTSGYHHSNYHITTFGTNRNFSTGYFSPGADTWVEIQSPNNLLRIGEWFHLTFVRDTSSQLIVQMIHQPAGTKKHLPGWASDSLELMHLGAYDYGQAGETGPPAVSGQPLFIGASPQNDTLYSNLDGWLDEIHISNTARSYRVPPIISDVTDLDHQQANQSYKVEANIETIGGNVITAAKLNYRLDGGAWQTRQMNELSDHRYAAAIPGEEVGTVVEYWIEAETDDGRHATHPKNALEDSNYYSFGIGRDSTTVFQLDFDQGDEVPRDQSEFGADLTLHGPNEATYADGDKGGDDRAMVFDAADSTWLETSSPFHELTNLAVDFKFYARDSIPPEDTRLLAKGSSSALYFSNYQVYFDPAGTLRPTMYAPDNDLAPCGTFTNICLRMDRENERIDPETWYRVQLGIRSPETTKADTGAIFSRLIAVASGDTVGERVYRTNGGAKQNSRTLKIGGTGNYYPYFNGLMDDIKIMNYLPDRYLPDSLKATDLNNPTELPQQATLKQNYPNPFNPTTQIEYSLPRASDVQLIIYDLLGRRVATLVDGKRQAGNHIVTFDADHLSSGVYLYRLKTDNHRQSRKMLLIQ